jgi:hypothetical protein
MGKPATEKQLSLIRELAEETNTKIYRTPVTAQEAMKVIDRYMRWKKAGTKSRNRRRDV